MGRKLTETEMLEYQEQRKKNLEKSSALLGIPVEEIEHLEAKARAELEKKGNDWEKELDKKNRAKAGIE